MTSLIVRSGHIADLDFIVRCQMALAYETEKLELDEKTLRAGVKAVFSDPTKGEYFVAQLDQNPVGMLLTLPEWSDWRNGAVLWIHSVYTLKEHRKTGVYKSLYQHVKKLALATESIRGIRLYVEKENFPAKAVYQTLGMRNDHYELFEWMKTY